MRLVLNTLLLAVTTLVLGVSISMVISQWSANRTPSGQALAPAAAPLRDAVGSSYRTSGMVWVNRTGLSAWLHAYNERDQRDEDRIIATYETFTIPPNTMIEVVAADDDAIQLALLDGPMSGRRGWMLRPGHP